jgi:hypothetical protein
MVQRVLGHELAATTLDLYTRRSDGEDRILRALAQTGTAMRNREGVVNLLCRFELKGHAGAWLRPESVLVPPFRRL